MPYLNYSKSYGALQAESNYEFPAKKNKKYYGLDPREYVPRSSWHHTSKFYNVTNYYSLHSIIDYIYNDYDLGGEILVDLFFDLLKKAKKRGNSLDIDYVISEDDRFEIFNIYIDIFENGQSKKSDEK